MRKVFALYQDLDHGAEIDDELSNDEEPDMRFLVLSVPVNLSKYRQNEIRDIAGPTILKG